MTDDQRPSTSTVPLIRALRGLPLDEPTAEPLTNAEANAALRAGWGISGSPIEERRNAVEHRHDHVAVAPDFGGGARGTSPTPVEPTPSMNDLLREAARSRRPDGFTGINNVVRGWYGNEEE